MPVPGAAQLRRLRGVQLVRILSSIDRSMKTPGETMKRRGIGYVLALTVLVTLAGTAGMPYFERNVPGADRTASGRHCCEPRW